LLKFVYYPELNSSDNQKVAKRYNLKQFQQLWTINYWLWINKCEFSLKISIFSLKISH